MTGAALSFVLMAVAMAMAGAYLAFTPTNLLMKGKGPHFRPNLFDHKIPGWRRAIGVLTLLFAAGIAFFALKGPALL